MPTLQEADATLSGFWIKLRHVSESVFGEGVLHPPISLMGPKESYDLHDLLALLPPTCFWGWASGGCIACHTICRSNQREHGAIFQQISHLPDQLEASQPQTRSVGTNTESTVDCCPSR